MDFLSTSEFREAVKHLQAKKLLPTNLSSVELSQQLSAATRRQSFFSAENTLEEALADIKSKVQSIVNPQQVLRPGATHTVTEGFNPASARAAIAQLFHDLGYAPEEGTAGSLKDLSSALRIDLVIKTNVQLAHGAGRFVQQNADPDVLDLWPALELVRFEDRAEPRDWKQRWRIAAQVAADPRAAAALGLHGRMAALKSSGIWQALGDGAGGYTDTLGNPYPPFAFNSGMWTEELDREESEALGLLQKGQRAAAAALDLQTLFKEAA